MLFLTVIGVVILWWGLSMLQAYHLTTAVILLLLGTGFLFMIGKLGAKLEGKVVWFPVMLFFLGLALEYFNVFTIMAITQAPPSHTLLSNMIVIQPQAIVFEEPITIRIETILLFILVFTYVIGLIMHIKERR